MDSQATPETPQPPEWAAQLFQMIQSQNQRMEGLEQQLRGQQNGGSTHAPEISAAIIGDAVRESTAVQAKKKLPELPEFSGKRTEFRLWLI